MTARGVRRPWPTVLSSATCPRSFSTGAARSTPQAWRIKGDCQAWISLGSAGTEGLIMAVTVNLTALAPRVEVVAVVQFITLVQIRAGGGPAGTRPPGAGRAAPWGDLQEPDPLGGGPGEQ